jgi:hypothetical protein
MALVTHTLDQYHLRYLPRGLVISLLAIAGWAFTILLGALVYGWVAPLFA